jgi:large subunit ribosomal protein L4e
MAKNHRQAHGVSKYAGHQHSAESWGTGRAVARIPRVSGGGTHRAGQAAFGNMCRKGRMFAPKKTYRRWHRKINKNQSRFAVVSALAASASVPLVYARGHRIQYVPEIPLVVQDESIVSLRKTPAAVQLLRKIHAYPDVQKVKNSFRLRAGKGKMRNRRWIHRKGPLIIYNEVSSLLLAFRNLPGVDIVSVQRLNLLRLAPGGHFGRFCIWTSSAFSQLDQIYGTYKNPSKLKVDYRLPRALMTNSDLDRIVNSEEVQKVVRPKVRHIDRFRPKRNPYKNLRTRIRLNPYIAVLKANESERLKTALAKKAQRVQALKESAAKRQARVDKAKAREAPAKGPTPPKPKTEKKEKKKSDKPKKTATKKRIFKLVKKEGGPTRVVRGVKSHFNFQNLVTA